MVVVIEGGFLALVHRVLARLVRPPADEVIQTAIKPPRLCYRGFDASLRDRSAERRRREEAARRAANRIASGAPVRSLRVVEFAAAERARRP
jgi:hypothetical protein